MPQVHANGVDLEYETFGRKTDPAVLLIMGYAAQMTLWPVSLCEGLAAQGFRVIRFDNRDVGLSTHLSQLGVPNVMEALMKAMAGQKLRAPYSLDDMAADSIGLLDGLGMDSAHLVGASMGGMIAQIAAAKYPNRTRSLVSIMSTTSRRDLPQGKPEAIAVLTMPPASGSREDRMAQGRAIWTAIGSPGFRPTKEEMDELAAREVDHSPYDPEAPARQLVAMLAGEPRNEMLKSVRAPTLVIHGADDPLLPVACGEDTAASVPGAELVVIPGMGHDLPKALVPLLLEHIGNFLARVERKRSAA
ncbi:MAG: alpha/beta hydrolase [Alphaproteobacteria bacterium]|nr:alpha/beta hydrolase [Alphaproteobacteria bacterium]